MIMRRRRCPWSTDLVRPMDGARPAPRRRLRSPAGRDGGRAARPTRRGEGSDPRRGPRVGRRRGAPGRRGPTASPRSGLRRRGLLCARGRAAAVSDRPRHLMARTRRVVVLRNRQSEGRLRHRPLAAGPRPRPCPPPAGGVAGRGTTLRAGASRAPRIGPPQPPGHRRAAGIGPEPAAVDPRGPQVERRPAGGRRSRRRERLPTVPGSRRDRRRPPIRADREGRRGRRPLPPRARPGRRGGQAGSSIPRSRASSFMRFWSFSKARTSIWRMRSRLTS